MSAEQIHAAGLVIAVFSAVMCVVQIALARAVHWLWLLLLLAGIVATVAWS